MAVSRTTLAADTRALAGASGSCMTVRRVSTASPVVLLDLHDGLLHDLPAGVPIGHLKCRVLPQPPPQRFFIDTTRRSRGLEASLHE
jgi:hypothetical protein